MWWRGSEVCEDTIGWVDDDVRVWECMRWALPVARIFLEEWEVVAFDWRSVVVSWAFRRVLQIVPELMLCLKQGGVSCAFGVKI